MSRRALIGAALAGALCLPAAAPAVVPPKNCGTMTVKAKRYQIKADQMRCSRARDYSRRYLSTHRKPAGDRRSDYGAGTRLKFRCSRSVKVFFAIKR